PSQNLAQVIHYRLGGFDHTTLWDGGFIDAGIPQEVRLFLGPGNSADYIANPLSWPICSTRLVDFLSKRAPKDFQMFDAPLYRSSDGNRVTGYRIVNVLQRIACLDLTGSNISFDPDKKDSIFMLYDIAIKQDEVDPSVRLFRLAEWPYAIIV